MSSIVVVPETVIDPFDDVRDLQIAWPFATHTQGLGQFEYTLTSTTLATPKSAQTIWPPEVAHDIVHETR
jgi:hypothetical protein